MTKDELADIIEARYTPIGFNCKDPNCNCIEQMGAGEYAQRDTAKRIAQYIRELSADIK